MAELMDHKVDSLLDSCLHSVPCENPGSDVTPESSPDTKTPGKEQAVLDPETLTKQVLANAAKGPKNMVAHGLEGELMSKLDDPEYFFSADEVSRLMTVIASLPASADKVLQGYRSAMLVHPGLAEFRFLYSAPSWKTTSTDGSASGNNCSKSSRHVRMREAMVLALAKICIARGDEEHEWSSSAVLPPDHILKKGVDSWLMACWELAESWNLSELSQGQKDAKRGIQRPGKIWGRVACSQCCWLMVILNPWYWREN